VLALAAMAQRSGLAVGWEDDPAEPEWPVLVIELPTGQASWHFPREQAAPHLKRFVDDGHTPVERYANLGKLVKLL
jgi:hypothetical protein